MRPRIGGRAVMEAFDAALRWIGCFVEADRGVPCRSAGKITREGMGRVRAQGYCQLHCRQCAASDPASASRVARRRPRWTELKKLGLPVIFIDARHAKAALKMQIDKSDRNPPKSPCAIVRRASTEREENGRPGEEFQEGA